MKKNFIQNIKNLPQGVKASIAFFIASLISRGISYIVTPIYTRILSPEVYGQTSVYMTWLEIFGLIAMFCLSYGVFNNGMLDYPEKRDEFSFSMLILSNIITLAFSAILLSLYPIIKHLLKIDLPFLILMCAIFLFQPAYNFWLTRQRFELKYKLTVIWSIVSAVLSPTVAIICVLTSDESSKLFARIFGAEIVLIVIYVIFYVYLALQSKCKINIKYWKSALLFNLPLIPHYLSTYMLSNSDKIMISYIIGDAATAFYSISYSIAAIAMIIWTAINSSLIPYTYEKCKMDDYQAISKVVSPLIFLFAIISLIVIMVAPEVMMVFASDSYRESIYVIPPIVGGVFFQVQYYLYANIVYYHKKPKFIMLGSIVSMLANIVLNYFFIKKFGYAAAGYTTLACYFLQATIDFFAMRHVVGKNVYNMKLVGLFSLIIIIISLISNYVYDYILIRYGIVLIIVILLLVFRKHIFAIFKQLRRDKSVNKSCVVEKTPIEDINIDLEETIIDTNSKNKE